MTSGGAFVPLSSRAKKDDIRALSVDDALAVLRQLEPVQFVYKTEPDEEYVGFIAEDVPDLVATTDRNGLAPMDIVAVLTKIVQQQQARIDALEKRLGALAP